MKRTPSLFRIIRIDYLAFTGVIFPVVAWGLALVAPLFNPEAASFFQLVAPVVTVVGLALVFWRVWDMRSLFANGDEVSGIISGIGFFRGRGRIEYVYTYRGRKYKGGNAILSTVVTRSLVHGQEVTVVVDPFNPKHAFVRELYL